jgi:uncharacterized protein YceK
MRIISSLLMLLTLSGCASVREWTLPTVGQVDKSPEVLAACIQKAFDEHKVNYKTHLKQRVTQSAGGEIIWDQMDSSNSLLHRVVIAKSLEEGKSNYRVDALFVGLHGLGKIDICFK